VGVTIEELVTPFRLEHRSRQHGHSRYRDSQCCSNGILGPSGRAGRRIFGARRAPLQKTNVTPFCDRPKGSIVASTNQQFSGSASLLPNRRESMLAAGKDDCP